MQGRMNKKGQVSDAVTWIVATVAIVVIMMFFIFAASLFSETKVVDKYKSSLFSSGEDLGEDIFLEKSLYTFVLTKAESKKSQIMSYLEQRDSKKEFKSPLNESRKEIQSRYDLR